MQQGEIKLHRKCQSFHIHTYILHAHMYTHTHREREFYQYIYNYLLKYNVYNYSV